jgi:ABC-type transport system substrate-binding protein
MRESRVWLYNGQVKNPGSGNFLAAIRASGNRARNSAPDGLTMPTQTRWFLPILTSCLILAACSAARQEPPQTGVRPGGSFKLIHQSLPETLDPQRIVFLSDYESAAFMYEGLVGYGEKATSVQPLLAETWEESEEGRRYIFKLRNNLQFADDPCFPGGLGRKVTAGDVLYTFERIARADTNCANWYLFSGKIDGIDDFRAGRASTIKGIQVLDDRRIEFHLTKSYATFLKILASPTAFVVPREAVKFYGADFGNHPVGTGPFRLARWKPLEQIVLVKNDHYWRSDVRGVRLPYLDSIDIRYRADTTESVMVAAFLKAETFLLAAQEKLYSTLKEDLLKPDKCRMVGLLPAASLRFLGFSLETASPLARNPDLRRAVAMAFDRQQLVRQAPQANAILAHTLVPPVFLNRSLSWYPYDPKRARDLLNTQRMELEASTNILASNYQSDDVMLLQECLARVSVKSTVRIRPVNYYQYIVTDRPTVFRVSFTPSFFDPEDFYCLFYSKSSRDVNLTGYRNAEFDHTLEAAMVELDAARRTELFQHLEEILHRDLPAIYLFHSTPTYLIAAPFVRGMTIRFILPNLTETWLEPRDETRDQPQPQK